MISKSFCRKCEKSLPTSDFYLRVDGKPSSLCKTHFAHGVLVNRRRTRSEVMAAYGNKCACCGEQNLFFLTLDHVNRDGAAERGGSVDNKATYAKARRENFPDIYQILCFNCNCGRELNDGICPHVSRNVPVWADLPVAKRRKSRQIVIAAESDRREAVRSTRDFEELL